MGQTASATPSMRKIEQGDLVTIDFGTRYQDYCSDITRTVAVARDQKSGTAQYLPHCPGQQTRSRKSVGTSCLCHEPAA